MPNRDWSDLGYMDAIIGQFWRTPDGAWKAKRMTKAQKTLSIRVDTDDYAFLNCLTEAEKANVSETVRDLVRKGRLMLAMEQYRAGKASLGKAAEIAGLSISETIDLFVEYGIPVNLDFDDYLQSMEHARRAW